MSLHVEPLLPGLGLHHTEYLGLPRSCLALGESPASSCSIQSKTDEHPSGSPAESTGYRWVKLQFRRGGSWIQRCQSSGGPVPSLLAGLTRVGLISGSPRLSWSLAAFSFSLSLFEGPCIEGREG